MDHAGPRRPAPRYSWAMCELATSTASYSCSNCCFARWVLYLKRHRRWTQSAAPPRKVVSQASRTEDAIARRQHGEPRQLLTTDAGSVVGVGEEHDRSDADQLTLQRNGSKPVEIDHVGLPLTKRQERIPRVGLRRPDRSVLMRGHDRLSAVTDGFEPAGHLVPAGGKSRDHAGEIAFDASGTGARVGGKGDAHDQLRKAATVWRTSNRAS